MTGSQDSEGSSVLRGSPGEELLVSRREDQGSWDTHLGGVGAQYPEVALDRGH